MTVLLEVKGLVVRYGAVEAVRGIDLTVDEGEIVTVLGANGAGKSSTLRALAGVTRPAAGRVLLAGEDITRLPGAERPRRGLVLVPEGRKIFGVMTVFENLEMGAFGRSDSSAQQQDLEMVFSMFPVLAERRHRLAGHLSGGEQQMLAIGRGLMARPRLMMLDEPSLGLAPIVAQRIFALIREINAHGTTVLLVEQNAMRALRVASRGYVLETGRVVLAGPSQDLVQNPHVRTAYLGEVAG